MKMTHVLNLNEGDRVYTDRKGRVRRIARVDDYHLAEVEYDDGDWDAYLDWLVCEVIERRA